MSLYAAVANINAVAGCEAHRVRRNQTITGQISHTLNGQQQACPCWQQFSRYQGNHFAVVADVVLYWQLLSGLTQGNAIQQAPVHRFVEAYPYSGIQRNVSLPFEDRSLYHLRCVNIRLSTAVEVEVTGTAGITTQVCNARYARPVSTRR